MRDSGSGVPCETGFVAVAAGVGGAYRASVSVEQHPRRSFPLPRARRRARANAVEMASGKGQDTNAGLRLLESTINFGLLVRAARTAWHTGWLILMNELAPSSGDGSYARPVSTFRTVLTNEEVADTAGKAQPAYKVYLGAACPWCHRVALARVMSTAASGVEVVELVPSDEGLWNVAAPGENNGDVTLKQVYARYSPGYKGRATAPVLIDVENGVVVNNESADIVRMMVENVLTSGLPGEANNSLRPSTRAAEIDRWNDIIYTGLNNGVYSCGFAKTQAAYDAADTAITGALEGVEAALAQSADGFLLGDWGGPTECDIRLYPTIVRFDAVYSPLFKCGGAGARLIRADYPHLFAWAKRMYELPGVAETVDIPATRQSYFGSLFPLNPSGLIPAGGDPIY